MFAYCLNSPPFRVEVGGYLSFACDDDDVDPLDDFYDDTRGGGNKSGNTNLGGGGKNGGGSSSINKPSSSKQIPKYVRDMLEYLQNHNKVRPKGYKGGGAFANDGRNGSQVLPDTGAPYREFDVHPNVSGQGRGMERLVIGADDSAWFTPDHYKSFDRIQ